MNNSLFFVASLLLLSLNGALCWPDFFLYTQKNPSQYVTVTAQNISNSPFDVTKKTVLYIHGFDSDSISSIITDIRDELLKTYDFNVIGVDWRQGAVGPNYISAAHHTLECGEKIANFIKETKIDSKTIHCIGHSLGAHVCGYASKATRFSRISGLDPAGPLFHGVDAKERLDKTDADYVDIIHADALLGLEQSIGHKDYYPNGGKIQTGCLVFRQFQDQDLLNLNLRNLITGKAYDDKTSARFGTTEIACSHRRVMSLYAESVNSPCKFTATPCSDYADYKDGKCQCSSNNCVSMGYHSDPNVGAEGEYFLHTNKQSPFCMN